MVATPGHADGSANRRSRQRVGAGSGRDGGMTETVRIGLLRLVDSAPVMVAQSDGAFESLGLTADISIEPSWANVADKLSFGLLDAAIMLPPLALAAAAGLRGPKARLVVPLSLSQGGNAIVLGPAAEAALASSTHPPRLRLREGLRGVAPPP